MRRIVPLGGGGLADPALLAQILEMTGEDRPRVCYVPTASGDPVEAIEAFHAALPSDRAVATDLALFRMDGRDPRQVLLEQDVIYVGGGSTANMLAVWRVHGVDGVMAEAWESGIVLTGASAGAICWFEDGVTDSFRPGARPAGRRPRVPARQLLPALGLRGAAKAGVPQAGGQRPNDARAWRPTTSPAPCSRAPS